MEDISVFRWSDRSINAFATTHSEKICSRSSHFALTGRHAVWPLGVVDDTERTVDEAVAGHGSMRWRCSKCHRGPPGACAMNRRLPCCLAKAKRRVETFHLHAEQSYRKRWAYSVVRMVKRSTP